MWYVYSNTVQLCEKHRKREQNMTNQKSIKWLHHDNYDPTTAHTDLDQMLGKSSGSSWSLWSQGFKVKQKTSCTLEWVSEYLLQLSHPCLNIDCTMSNMKN